MALLQTYFYEHDTINYPLTIPMLNGKVINIKKFKEVKLRSICPLSLESTSLLEQLC